MDTREITRRLRDTGALNGIITTDMSTSVEELVEKTKSWSILGKVHLWMLITSLKTLREFPVSIL